MKKIGVLVVLVASVSCGLWGPDDTPPTLIRYQILERDRTCFGCPVSGRQVTPTDNVLTLQLRTAYTARAVIRTSGDSNKCLPPVFRANWVPLLRDFVCHAETGRETIIDYDFATPTADNLGFEPKFLISLAEYTRKPRRMLTSERLYEFQVRLATPPSP